MAVSFVPGTQGLSTACHGHPPGCDTEAGAVLPGDTWACGGPHRHEGPRASPRLGHGEAHCREPALSSTGLASVGGSRSPRGDAQPSAPEEEVEDKHVTGSWADGLWVAPLAPQSHPVLGLGGEWRPPDALLVPPWQPICPSS